MIGLRFALSTFVESRKAGVNPDLRVAPAIDERVRSSLVAAFTTDLVSALGASGFFARSDTAVSGGKTRVPVLPWTSGDGGVSAEAAASQPSDTSGVNTGGDGKLTLEIRTEEFGPLSIVLERTEDGVSLLIAGDGAAKNALLADRQGLIDALTGGGSTVRSVRILRREELGIVLAEGSSDRASSDPTSSNRKGKGADKAPAESPLGRNPKSSTRRRLNLIG